MSQLTPEAVEKAITDLLQTLSDAHGVEISIGGCGCCGSPWLDVGKDTQDRLFIQTKPSEKEKPRARKKGSRGNT